MPLKFIAVILILILSRPTGIIFIIPALIFFLFSTCTNRNIRILYIWILLIFLAGAFLIAKSLFQSGGDINAIKPAIEEPIICLVPGKNTNKTLDIKYSDDGLKDLAYYIYHNPIHFINLAGKRLLSFFSLTRPWYSSIYNLFLKISIWPGYFFFFSGLLFSRPFTNIHIYIFSCIGWYSMIIALQCDDWHGRFTMPMLPLIFVIAASGINTVLKWLAQRRKITS